LVSYWLGLGAPARFASLAALLVGAAFFCGCNSLSAASGASSPLPTADGNTAAEPPTEDAASVGTSCHPGNVETFVPAAYRHSAPAGQGACVSTDGGPDPIAAYYNDCFGSGMTKAACDGFALANPTCNACIETAETASVYGPLVLSDGFVQANIAGCIELESPSNLACAQAQQALSDCELAACAANCPVVDQASLVLYEQCANQADGAGCLAYYSAALCLQTEVEAGAGSGPESACLAPTFEAFYAAIVPVFCGQMSSDAGPTSDASGPDGSVADASIAPPSDGGEVDAGIAAPTLDAAVDASADGSSVRDSGPAVTDGGDAM
jgi:hypothetical protein